MAIEDIKVGGGLGLSGGYPVILGSDVRWMARLLSRKERSAMMSSFGVHLCGVDILVLHITRLYIKFASVEYLIYF